MDVRLFKFIIFAGGEAALAGCLYLMPKLLPGGYFHGIAMQAVRNLMAMVPFFLLLPDDNWIWLVEDDPRQRKISLHSKATKHLYLSMLYWLALGLPFLAMTVSYLMAPPVPGRLDFRTPLTAVSGGGAFLMGTYCAWRNAWNVHRYDTLFAVAWDRHSSFIEIFIGMRVARGLRFFYPPLLLILFASFLAASGVLAPFYYALIEMVQFPDRQKFTVLAALFNFFFTFSVWTTTMYVFFQIFFLRRIENWAKQKDVRGDY